MIFADAKCFDCEYTFGISKSKMLDDFKIPRCPKCKSKNVKRVFSIGTFDIATGNCGTSKDGYQSGFGEHPSIFGKYKGKTIRKTK